MERPDRTHILKNHPGPVMFILGESDTAVPLADGLKQSHLPRLSYIQFSNEAEVKGKKLKDKRERKS